MFEAVSSPYSVAFDGQFRLASAPTRDAVLPKKQAKERLSECVYELYELQRKLYADNRFSVLCVFQAMDAAGKDSTIRNVFSGVNPAGFQVANFKQPSSEELEHDFLWRSVKHLPERGRIGVFNRSYYEEVLVVKVHPEYLGPQNIPNLPDTNQLFADRYQSIRDHELHLARNGTVVVKFFLNVSKDEQRDRLLARIDDPRKNWKFNGGDVEERQHWGQYMAAYEAALNQTSRPWAPWYAIPADDKHTMRYTVAEILVRTLKSLDAGYPVVDEDTRASLQGYRKRLLAED